MFIAVGPKSIRALIKFNWGRNPVQESKWFELNVSLHDWRRAVSELCGEDAKGAFQLQLKWPNDIYAGDLKVTPPPLLHSQTFPWF